MLLGYEKPAWALKGSDVCNLHSGGKKKVQSKGGRAKQKAFLARRKRIKQMFEDELAIAKEFDIHKNPEHHLAHLAAMGAKLLEQGAHVLQANYEGKLIDALRVYKDEKGQVVTIRFDANELHPLDGAEVDDPLGLAPAPATDDNDDDD